MQEVISHLSQECEVCLEWFSRNGMQANSTILLGIKIDRDVTFKEQISNICRKAGLQLSVYKKTQLYT